MEYPTKSFRKIKANTERSRLQCKAYSDPSSSSLMMMMMMMMMMLMMTTMNSLYAPFTDGKNCDGELKEDRICNRKSFRITNLQTERLRKIGASI